MFTVSRFAPPFVLLPLIQACSDYSFSEPTDAKVPIGGRQLGDVETGVDTAEQGDDSGALNDADELDTEACFAPEFGYEQNPAARLITDDDDARVSVTYVYSDTAYDDELWIDAPASASLARSSADAPGLQYTLGPWPDETEVVFALYVHDTGNYWRTGPSDRNSDNVIHGAATYEGDCTWLVGFEDLQGGGDRDYNDIVFRVHGQLRQER